MNNHNKEQNFLANIRKDICWFCSKVNKMSYENFVIYFTETYKPIINERIKKMLNNKYSRSNIKIMKFINLDNNLNICFNFPFIERYNNILSSKKQDLINFERENIERNLRIKQTKQAEEEERQRISYNRLAPLKKDKLIRNLKEVDRLIFEETFKSTKHNKLLQYIDEYINAHEKKKRIEYYKKNTIID